MNSPASSLLWALHNPLRSWTLYNLSENDLKMILMSLTENEIRLLKVCKNNETQWQSLDKSKHADFFAFRGPANIFYNNKGYPPVESNADSVTDTEYFIIKPNRVQHPRLHQRYEIVVPCVLIGSNNKEFHTETIDLSEGGLHFKDSIPNWIAGYFLVIVKSNFQLMCSLVEDQKEKKRVQIVSEDSDFNFIQYKNWLSSN